MRGRLAARARSAAAWSFGRTRSINTPPCGAMRGHGAVELHAQVHAAGFYDKAGYTPYGEVYLEAGIEHVSMRKELS